LLSIDTFAEGFGLSAATAVAAHTVSKTSITSRESVRTLNIAVLLFLLDEYFCSQPGSILLPPSSASYQAFSDLRRPNPLDEVFIPKESLRRDGDPSLYMG